MANFGQAGFGSGGFNAYQGRSEQRPGMPARQQWNASGSLSSIGAVGMPSSMHLELPQLPQDRGKPMVLNNAQQHRLQGQQGPPQRDTSLLNLRNNNIHGPSLADVNNIPSNRQYGIQQLMLNKNDEPWAPYRNPHMIRTPTRQTGRSNAQDLISQSGQPNYNALHQRVYSRPSSESAGQGLGQDSAYYSQSARSVSGLERAVYGREVPELGQFEEYQPFQESQSHSAREALRPPSQRSRSRSTTRREQNQNRRCTYCNASFKNESEFKKHLLKHEKNFRCSWPGCKRQEGFGTQNDLTRHEKTVHKKGLHNSKNYRCVAPNCQKPEKLWPRLDNFKQHITRMHPDEDLDAIVMRSEVPANNAATHAHNAGQGVVHNIDPSHDLANIGTEFEIPADLPSGFSLSPENPRTGTSDVAEFSIVPQDSGMYPSAIAPGDLHSNAGQRLLTSTPATAGARQISPFSNLNGQNNTGLETLANVATQNRPSLLSSEEPNLDPQLSSPPDKLPQNLNELSQHIVKNYPEQDIAFFLGDTAAKLSTNPSTVLRDSRSFNAVAQNTITSMPVNHGDKHRREETISRTEVLNGLKRLASLVKRQNADRISPSGLQRKPRITDGRACPISGCRATLPRECELTKHMKRHTRPYGCTFPKCKKAFGSKSDWKRHENSQHYQLEMWRCLRLKADGSQCAKVSYNKEMFLNHLREPEGKQHAPVPADEFENTAKAYRVGRNGQTRFWCGFCKNIIELKTKGTEAWDERFDHIDEKHFKNGQRVLNWLCFEEDKTKEELEGGMDKNKFDDPDPPVPTYVQDDDDIHFVGGDSHGQRGRKRARDVTDQDGARKRASRQEDKGRRVEYFWECCQCDSGPYPLKLYRDCLSGVNDCDHKFCDNCPRRVMEVDETGPGIDLDLTQHME